MVFVVHGVCAHMCMQKPEDNRSPFYFLRQGLSLNLKLTYLTSLNLDLLNTKLQFIAA